MSTRNVEDREKQSTNVPSYTGPHLPPINAALTPSSNQVAPETCPSVNNNEAKIAINVTTDDNEKKFGINDGNANKDNKLTDSVVTNLQNKNFLNPYEQNRRVSIKVLEDSLNEGDLTRRKTIHHKVRSWLIPSETPANVKIFGGRRAVQEERIRSRNAGWIIHPYSNLR